MKAMLKYRGGKSKEIPHFLKYIPSYTGRYIEPFLGGGSVFFYLQPKRAIINDLNSSLMTFYKGVRDEYQKVHQELTSLEATYIANRAAFEILKKENPTERVEDKNEQLYYELRDMFNGISHKKYTEAALYYFINKTAYSGMIRYNAKGEFNVPYGRYKNFNTQLVTEEHSKLLNQADLYNCDYSNVFALSQPEDFMFLDPPYDCIFSDYGNEKYKEGFDEECHRKLAQDFRNLSCKAMMVIGKTPLTAELYQGMIIDEYSKNYSVNIRNRFKASANHIIVTNY